MEMNEIDELCSGAAQRAPLHDARQARQMYRMMCQIRAAEHKLAMMRKEGLIGGPVHLGVGQEAVAAGVSAHLRSTDRVFGAHRSHSHLLALGSSVKGLFAEVLGKESGLSKGMGGSMHLWDQPRGFYGSVPIVAGTVSLAVGAGLAAKLANTTDVAVSYFGDGAIEEGVVHESLNFARMQNVPVLFVVENNLFASHMHISIRQPDWSTARFAAANHIPFEVVDGNDVVAVACAAERLISRARAGDGPGFLEAYTYRWYGHVDSREDIDVGINRSKDDIQKWRARDPVTRMRDDMKRCGMWSDQDEAALIEEIVTDVDAAWSAAMSDPYPSLDSLTAHVYANKDPR